MLKRPILIAAGLVTVVLIAGLGGAYVYFFSGLRTAPKPLGLSRTTASSSATPTASATSAGSLTGNWTVATGSLAGYRVREQFVNQSSTHDAVARTSSVSGGLTVEQGASGVVATGIKLTARLADLKSVDQVAGFHV